MLYSISTAIAASACLYLLLRKGNAFDPTISTPPRLRRWAAIFFGLLALGHLYYLPSAIFNKEEDIILWKLIGALLDSVTIFPTAIIVLLCMLQDKRRPLWPVFLMIAPIFIIILICIILRSYALRTVFHAYMLLLGVGLVIYLVRAVKQYGRWLRDNYADLEDKEVWHTFLVFAGIILVFGVYSSSEGSMLYEFVIQVLGTLMTCFILWRVETLSDLSISQTQTEGDPEQTQSIEKSNTKGTTTEDDENISALLQKHCIDAKLYLQHDLTVAQLARAICINRLYLSNYFSRQATTYNAYINMLRIKHFLKLYNEAIAEKRSFTALQLAKESGFRSYSTFSLAFKQRTGQSVTAWMQELQERQQEQ
jgi:AraC-like DNA-binding protein